MSKRQCQIPFHSDRGDAGPRQRDLTLRTECKDVRVCTLRHRLYYVGPVLPCIVLLLLLLFREISFDKGLHVSFLVRGPFRHSRGTTFFALRCIAFVFLVVFCSRDTTLLKDLTFSFCSPRKSLKGRYSRYLPISDTLPLIGWQQDDFTTKSRKAQQRC